MNNNRPLSPHLSIYKWQITNTLSILHRLAGVGLFFSFLTISCFLVYSYYYGTDLLHNIWGIKIGYFATKIFILLTILGFAYHFSNGIRYLYFDISTNITNVSIQITAYIMLVCAVLLALFLSGILLFD